MQFPIRTCSLSVVVLIVVATVSCNRPATPRSTGPVGNPAPEISSTTLDGQPFQLSALKGRIILLDFWATWCGPCVIELPILMQVAKEFEQDGVELYAINDREDQQEIRNFLDSNQWELNVVLDPKGDFGNAYGVNGIPHLVVIDREGKIRSIHVGFSPGIRDELSHELRQLIASQGGAKKVTEGT